MTKYRNHIRPDRHAESSVHWAQISGAIAGMRAAIRNRGVDQIMQRGRGATLGSLHAIAREHRRTVQGKPVPYARCHAVIRDWTGAAEAMDDYRQSRQQEYRGASSPTDRRHRAIRNAAELAAELDSDRRRQIADAYDDAFEHGSVRVHFASDPADCGVAVDSEKDWDGYSKSCRYPMIMWDVQVTAMMIRRSDLPGGSRVLQGMCTLAAEEVEQHEYPGAKIWRATWTRKNRGVAWTVCRGYIVEVDGEFAHSTQIAGGIATLRRRRTISRTNHRYITIRQALARGQANGHGDVPVDFRQARRAGLCDSGIRDFVARNFPAVDVDHDTLTVRQLIAVPGQRAEVAAACLVAIRDSRRA